MERRNPNMMAHDEIVREIEEHRDTITSSAARIVALSLVLRSHARRQASVEPVMSNYVIYANAWSRFASSVGQGVQRLRTASRALQRARQEEALQPASEGAKPVTTQKDIVGSTEAGARKGFEDLESLFGAGTVTDALR